MIFSPIFRLQPRKKLVTGQEEKERMMELLPCRILSMMII